MKNFIKFKNFLTPLFRLDKKANNNSLDIFSNINSEDKYDALFNLNPVATYITSLDEGKIVKVNQAFLKLYGYSKEEMLGKRILEINIYENPLDRDKIVKEIYQNGFYENIELKLKNKERQQIIGLSSAKKITIDGIYYIIGVLQDITNQKLMEAELIKREYQYRNLFDNATEMICVIQDSKIKIFNAIFGKLTGYEIEDVISTNYLEFIFPEDREYIRLKYAEHLKEEKHNNRYQFRMLKKDKTEIWVEISSVQIEWEERPAILCFLTDIEERKNRENEVLYLSYYDQLTGLYNRRFYEKELQNINSLECLPLSIIMADVNGLKLTNDAFGHLTGDRLLKETAKVIKEKCRETDIAARIGGDEFVVLLPNTNSADALQIEERMKINLNNRKFGNTYLSVSFGSYTKKRNDEDIKIILT